MENKLQKIGTGLLVASLILLFLEAMLYIFGSSFSC